MLARKIVRTRDENAAEVARIDSRPVKKHRTVAELPTASKLGTVTTKRAALADLSNRSSASQNTTASKILDVFPAVKTYSHIRPAQNDENAVPVPNKRIADIKSESQSTRAVAAAASKVVAASNAAARPFLRAPRRKSSTRAEIPTTKQETKQEDEEEEESVVHKPMEEDSVESAEDMSIGEDEQKASKAQLCVASDSRRKRSVSELMPSLLSMGLSSKPAALAPVVPVPVRAHSSVEELIEDIDIGDRADPSYVTDYVEDIFAIMREKESSSEMASKSYMKAQKGINEKVRGILVDWMVDVATQFGLLAESIYLGVQLMDRLLSKKEVSKDRIQLVGMTALLIASKFEETRTPWVDDFIWISAEAYTRQDVLRVEKIILMVVDFNLTLPTPIHFLRRFSKASKSDSQVHTLSKYLSELSLPDYRMLRYPPSMIAAAAVYVARVMQQRTPRWTSTLQHYTQYSEAEILPCAKRLAENHSNPEDNKYFVAIKKKYANPTLHAVSTLPGVEL